MRAVLDSARRHLATTGAGTLSVRAIARDVGMVSSAVYRYVPSRDALLTLLVIEAYDDVGEAAERAERAVVRDDRAGRFLAVCEAVRAWALANPHEYALIYGTPVPGYAAPQDTIGPATRIASLLIGILRDIPGSRGGHVAGSDAPVASAIAPLRDGIGSDLPPAELARGLNAWTGLVGAVSLETFGHFTGVIAQSPRVRKAFFASQMRSLAAGLGLFE
jgi:AcrR family transcriptional regulator